ncbi:MAG TPA: 50S ribosomal protein L9 [Candidatus Hydrogenedens sp.]|nr:50S ribosomal protein L9 [Candidatus Hydrogenedens sp.]HOL18749.1 50S ribosomal protein L9 [Candidatus Hydrogenedens sp.]HPP59101.1 50S ribosomal protein L9 [Candidatus Hydrogenedens sp.]
MKVILCRDIEKLGKVGETVNVADGFARNYLIPRKLAVSVQSASAAEIKHHFEIIQRRETKRKAQMESVAKQLNAITIEFKIRAGDEDKLFGSVTSAMIAEELHKMHFDIDRKQIVLEEPIKTLGIFCVPVKLGSGVTAELKVWVSQLTDENSTENNEG